MNWPPILKRAQAWKLLHPGEMVRETIKRDRLQYEDKGPGTYEFWAEYHPPAMEPEDQKTLHKAGIDFPKTKLSSPRVTFTRKP